VVVLTVCDGSKVDAVRARFIFFSNFKFCDFFTELSSFWILQAKSEIREGGCGNTIVHPPFSFIASNLLLRRT